jgi:hypothetical protein
VTEDAVSIRRLAGVALVTGLCVAAAAAVVALLTGSFGAIDTRVILSSLGFSLFSATGSAGAAARLRPSERVQMLGTATMFLSIAAFGLLFAGLWGDTDDWGDEGLWRTFGCLGVSAVAGSHACVTLGPLRPTDSELVRLLSLSAVGLAVFDALAVILPLAEVFDDIEDPWPRIFGASLVLLMLTTILPPLLRRMQPTSQPAASASGSGPSASANGCGADEFLATAVIRIADKIELLNGDPGNRAPEIQAEVNRLRKLAQSFEN